jgi:hypothetical protein
VPELRSGLYTAAIAILRSEYFADSLYCLSLLEVVAMMNALL